MFHYGSTDKIKRKIREGVYRTFVKQSTNKLWKYFVGISSSVTLHMVVPWYYRLQQHCRIDAADSNAMKKVKVKARVLSLQL